MVDAEWLTPTQAGARVEVSSAAIRLQAPRLQQVGLARRFDDRRWQIAASAVGYRLEHGRWPDRPLVSPSDDELVASLDRAELASARVALKDADLTIIETRLGASDSEVARLKSENDRLKSAIRALQLTIAELLGSPATQ